MHHLCYQQELRDESHLQMNTSKTGMKKDIRIMEEQVTSMRAAEQWIPRRFMVALQNILWAHWQNISAIL